jgi:menaquinone-dependent protoporphyrinogen oxidase
MSRVLVLYGTTDGHTRKIAAALAGVLRWEGSCVDVIDTKHVSPDVRPEGYDGVVIAGSIQIGNYQRAVERWVRRHADELNREPSAFVSVCLGVLDRRPEARQEASAIMERFLRRNGWRPLITRTVAGAVPYTQYNWLKKWVMKRVVAKAGGDTDTTRDYEYTDWNDLRAFAREFAGRVEVGHPAGGMR